VRGRLVGPYAEMAQGRMEYGPSVSLSRTLDGESARVCVEGRIGVQVSTNAGFEGVEST
jgi:hypothetical protein